MQTDSYEEDRKARLNEEGKYLRVKSPRDIDWSTPLWEQLAPVLKGGPNPGTSHDELRTIRANVPEMTTFLLNGLFPADNVITAAKNHAVHKITDVRTCSMGPQCNILVQSIGSADDDCHMVS